MKLSRLLYLASFILLLVVGCSKGRKNELQPRDGGHYPYHPGNPKTANVFHSIRCHTGFGPRRIEANLRAQGSFHDGYFNIQPNSPLLPRGPQNYGSKRIYVGASTVGDLIVVQPISSSEAHVSLHLCEQRNLIMPGRHVVQAYIDVGRGIVLKSRPNCQVDEVTAANLMVYLGPYREYSGTQFPISFTRVQDIAPELCSTGTPYWP